MLPIQLAVGLQLFASWTRLPAKVPGELNLAEAIRSLREVVPEDTIVCNGAGNYASWAHRFYRYERFGTQFAPTSGSMGYGIPAAVAAKRIYPEKTVIAFAGGGCFLMNGQEFATAVQYELPIWRAGGAHAGFRANARARSRLGQTRDSALHDGSASHHAEHHARRD